MTEASPVVSTWTASDGYPIHVARWPARAPKGRIVVLHGVQSHEGWYRGLGQRLANAGFETHFPDRRGSGANQRDRGDTPSAPRLIEDIGELLLSIRQPDLSLPTALVGISWGGKLAVLAAKNYPERVDALALLCPGLQPRVGVSLGERLRIAWAYFTNRKRRFPIPLGDPALFTANSEAQSFIANDPLSLREATAGLLAASTMIDWAIAKAPGRMRQPVLLMLAGQDRIVDNAKTKRYFSRVASVEKRIIEYPEAHHTLEFEPDPARHSGDLIDWLEQTMLSSRTRPFDGNGRT